MLCDVHFELELILLMENKASLISSVVLMTALKSCHTVAFSMLSFTIVAIGYISPPLQLDTLLIT